MSNIIKSEKFSIENLNPQIADLSTKLETSYEPGGANYLVLDFGQKTNKDVIVATMLYTSDKENKIRMTGAGCGCTKPSFRNISDTEQHLVIEFDSSKVTNNVSKWVTLTLENSKVIKINIVINKS